MNKNKALTSKKSWVPPNLNNLVWNVVGGVSTALGTIILTRFQVENFSVDQLYIMSLWVTGQAMLGLADAGMSATCVRVYTSFLSGAEMHRDSLKRCLLTFEKVYLAMALVVLVCAVAVMMIKTGKFD